MSSAGILLAVVSTSINLISSDIKIELTHTFSFRKPKTGFSHGVVLQDFCVALCRMRLQPMTCCTVCQQFSVNWPRNCCSRKRTHRTVNRTRRTQSFRMAATITAWITWITTKVHRCWSSVCRQLVNVCYKLHRDLNYIYYQGNRNKQNKMPIIICDTATWFRITSLLFSQSSVLNELDLNCLSFSPYFFLCFLHRRISRNLNIEKEEKHVFVLPFATNCVNQSNTLHSE